MVVARSQKVGTTVTPSYLVATNLNICGIQNLTLTCFPFFINVVAKPTNLDWGEIRLPNGDFVTELIFVGL